MEPAVDMDRPRTVPVTRPGVSAAQPTSPPMAGDPGNHPQSADLHPSQADPQRPTAEPQSVGTLAGAAAKAAPTPLNPSAEEPWRAGQIGRVLAMAIVAIAITVSYATFGLTPMVISTTVPLVVAEIGVVVLLLALIATVTRRRLHLAVQRGRSQAQEEAWSRHQQFLRRLDHELRNLLTAVQAAVAGLPQAPLHELQARVDVVDAQARHMERLVTGLRKLVDLEAAALSLKGVDITETVHDTAQAVGEEGVTRGGRPRIRLDLPQMP